MSRRSVHFSMGGAALCGVFLFGHDPDGSHIVDDVTCKRCLAKIARLEEQAIDRVEQHLELMDNLRRHILARSQS